MVMSAQMNGHSTAVVKAQLSSRHTFSGKNNRTEITSPSQPANRTPAPESALPFNGRFLKRILEAFSHASSFLEALASLSRFFSGTDFPEKAFARTDASFLFIFILFILQFLFLRMRGFGNHPAPLRGTLPTYCTR